MKKQVNLSISKSLLQKIENNIVGKNRSDKIEKCLKLGYTVLTTQPKSTIKTLEKGLERHARR